MNLEEIYQVLKDKFGDAVLALDTELFGDHCIHISPAAIADVCTFLEETDTLAFDSLMCLSGVDFSATDEEFAVVYHLYSMNHRHKVVLKTPLPKTDPHLPSVSHIWKTADWHEREAYDLYGILFEGHTDLRRLLLPDDWEGYPLRKDYQEPDFYRGMRVPY
ncbi:NADH-quinone oxidoreductase subunit C [Candidatus Poribacteria bacterium]|nr:MAG: NADH-quinone oxidoreductase subunit C [Candidatus Poribacteria bacterium]